MMDAQQQTQAMLKDSLERVASEPPGSEPTDLALVVEDLAHSLDVLEKKIARKLEILGAKDAATAAEVKQAVKDDFLSKRMKARALRIRICHKVKGCLLAALPYKRRICRAKNGEGYSQCF